MSDRHHLDREFALPTTQQVLESLGRFSEPGTISRDRLDRRLDHRCIRFWDAGEGQVVLDTSDAAIPNPPRVAVGEAE